MPVKVRCGGCEQAFNVPDKARGKTITCPKCSEKIKVPAGDDAPPAKSGASKAVAKPKAKPSKNDGQFLGGLDDYGIEDQEEQICPFCAAPIDEEDEICPGCGKDLSTGQMDKTEQKKRSKEGKSSASFYKNVMRESWEFMWEFKSLALRTGVILTSFTVLYMACVFMVSYCERMPPKYFWIGMTVVMAVGSPGWIWFLTRKIVHADLYGEKIESDRIFYDFFTNVALGLAAFLWPCVVNLPVLLPAALMGLILHFTSELPEISQLMLFTWGLGIMILPGIAFPIATVHMVAKHQHKAWIGWELIKLIFKNIGPIFVYHASSLVILTVFGSIAFVSAFFGGTLHYFNNEIILRWTSSITMWLYGLIDSQPAVPGSFMFVIVQMPLMFLFVFVFVAPLMLMLGFPLLFQMKINGLIARHFSHSLDLDQRIMPCSPAGFWVRFLAFCVDIVLFPLAPLLVSRDKRFVLLGLGMYGLMGLSCVFIFLMGSLPVSVLYGMVPTTIKYTHWMYFSVSLSGPIRATLGMEAFGLIAIPDIPNPKQKDLDKVLTLGQASLRWICVNLSLGFGFLLCAFHPERKALADMLSKSRIVFEGDK